MSFHGSDQISYYILRRPAMNISSLIKSFNRRIVTDQIELVDLCCWNSLFELQATPNSTETDILPQYNLTKNAEEISQITSTSPSAELSNCIGHFYRIKLIISLYNQELEILKQLTFVKSVMKSIQSHDGLALRSQHSPQPPFNHCIQFSPTDPRIISWLLCNHPLFFTYYFISSGYIQSSHLQLSIESYIDWTALKVPSLLPITRCREKLAKSWIAFQWDSKVEEPISRSKPHQTAPEKSK